MSKSPNNMNDGGIHFLYRREIMIRFKMLQKNMPQKMLAKRLNLTESYISKLIIGKRYNKNFERYIIHIFIYLLLLFIKTNKINIFLFFLICLFLNGVAVFLHLYMHNHFF